MGSESGDEVKACIWEAESFLTLSWLAFFVADLEIEYVRELAAASVDRFETDLSGTLPEVVVDDIFPLTLLPDPASDEGV
ncbi:hypothetical protein PC116_g32437 [Phytophthora cactorum]|nr:hypothetical protein PC116_g32437 [Phytophthora cactorum]